jgi:uncharacterized protein (TIGR02466 family)
MNILDLFPTPVGLHNLGRELTEEEIAILNNIKENTRRNGGGNLTSINTTILEIDDLLNLKSVLTKYVNDYFKQVFNPNTEMELYITQSWLNVNDNGTGHHPHSHHNSLVSCVYYIDSYNGDEIAFKNPNEFLGNFKINSDNPGRWCVNDLKIPVFKNHLLIFPSSLYHMVPQRPSTLNGTRISLSFNTWFKGEIGDTKELTYLKC